jgi:hypothetical protein
MFFETCANLFFIFCPARFLSKHDNLVNTKRAGLKNISGHSAAQGEMVA